MSERHKLYTFFMVVNFKYIVVSKYRLDIILLFSVAKDKLQTGCLAPVILSVPGLQLCK